MALAAALPVLLMTTVYWMTAPESAVAALALVGSIVGTLEHKRRAERRAARLAAVLGDRREFLADVAAVLERRHNGQPSP